MFFPAISQSTEAMLALLTGSPVTVVIPSSSQSGFASR